LISFPASAEWSQDLHFGIPVTDDTDPEYSPKIVEDGYGSFIVTWVGASGQILAQKVDNAGNVLWDSGGILVNESEWALYGYEVVADGMGGAIIIFVRPLDSVFEVLATHVDSEGTVDWGDPVNLVPGEEGLSDQYSATVVPDGSGGAIVAFMDDRDNTVPYVCAQRISNAGDLLWGDLGSYVCPFATTQENPVVVSDGNGGAFVA
jgi:hypothetical protein